MKLRKIMCPIDFSAGSEQAMCVASRLAIETDAELVLLHSWYVPPIAFAGGHIIVPATLFQDVSNDAKQGLDEAILEVTALGAKRVSAKLVSGLPWTVIVSELEDPTYDLVVIGTHGRSGLARILLGSVAEKIVRHAPCSVLAVRPDAEAKPFTNILCPTDFSDTSQHAGELALSLVAPGGKVTLLHVVEIPVAYSGEPAVEGFIRDLDQHANKLLETWAAQLRKTTPVPITARSRIGSPGTQTLHVLDLDPTIDLIVMGTHGRTGISRMLLGSVAEKIMRHARCPVLVARRRS